MIPIKHPAFYVPHNLADALRHRSAEAEKLGRLHPEQLDIIYENKWFRLFVPASYGGLELSLVDALCLEEALAWADGSTGWSVTLCGGANWFIGFLDPVLAKQLFNDKKVCLAGSGRASGRAKFDGDGYEISGFWNYATGAPQATAFTANCIIEEDGAIVTNDDGSPRVRSFLFLKEEVKIYENWSVMGMIATASYGFEVTKLRVGKNRCFEINKHPFLTHPIYRYPFMQFAETTLAVNSSGMSMRFLDLVEHLAGEERGHKKYPPLLRSKMVLQGARQVFYDAVQRSWDAFAISNKGTEDLLQTVSQSSRRLASVARQLVDDLYPYCGIRAADPATEMNRVWRDLHTASQHGLLNVQDE